MTLNISHSGVYGTEDWFNGEPLVYDNTEVDAFCELIVSLYRQMPGNYMLQSEDNPVGGFDSLDLGSELIDTWYTPSGSQPGPAMAVSSGNYVYYYLPSNLTFTQIKEYSIADNEITGEFTVGRWINSVSLISERKVLVQTSVNTPVAQSIFELYDFETNTVTELWRRNTYYSDDESYNENYFVQAIVTKTVNGQDISAVVYYGFRSMWAGPPNVSIPYCEVQRYNHSTETLELSNRLTLASDDYVYALTAYWYGNSVMIGNNFISGWNVDSRTPGTSNYFQEIPFTSYNIATNELEMLTIFTAEGTTPSCYDIGYNEPDNSIYVAIREGYTGVSVTVYKLDLTSKTFTAMLASANWVGVIRSSNRAYPYEQVGVTPSTADITEVYEPPDFETPILSVEGGYGYVSYSNMSDVDEQNNVIWFFRNSEDKLEGFPLDGSTAHEIYPNIPGSILFPYRTRMYLQGKYMLVSVMRSVARTCHFYIVKP